MCEDARIDAILTQPNAPTKQEFLDRIKYNASLNKDAFKTTLAEYNLQKIKWPDKHEKLFANVDSVLKTLQQKYKLGIIANQSPGLNERLENFKIKHYFDVIISSAEVGVEKPSLEIFLLALNSAQCLPEQTVMVGDRLDNDIIPAHKLGMKTVWVKQGYGGMGNVDLLDFKPDYVIESIEHILDLKF